MRLIGFALVTAEMKPAGWQCCECEIPSSRSTCAPLLPSPAGVERVLLQYLRQGQARHWRPIRFLFFVRDEIHGSLALPT